MPQHPRVTSNRPTAENTCLASEFRAQAPARYVQPDADKYVLVAAHPHLEMAVPATAEVALPGATVTGACRAALYVLETSVILWPEGHVAGIELPYPLVVLHALRDGAGGPELYMQIASGELVRNLEASGEFETTELLFREAGGPETGGETREPASMGQLYDAISRCLALHFDSDDSDPDEPSPEWFTADSAAAIDIPAHWSTAGDADDLDGCNSCEDGTEAGMNVNMSVSAIAGAVRKRGDPETPAKRLRR